MLRLEATAGSQNFNWISSAVYPNLAAGKTAIKLFGQAQGYNNQGYIGFKYAGSGSGDNTLTFGFYANDFLVNLLANGNLGIGTPSPAGLLTIKGTGDAIRVESTNTGAGGAQMDLLHFTTSPADGDTFGMINMGGYYTGTTSVYGTSIKSIWTDVSARNADLTFSTNNSGTLTETIRLTAAGNVGIKFTSPDGYATLTVNGTSSLPILGLRSSSGKVRFGFYEGGTGRFYIDTLNGSDGLALVDGDGVSQRIHINSLGDIGIGTPSPNRKLHVNGKAIIGSTANYSSNSGTLHVYGNNAENSGMLDIMTNGNGRYYTRVCYNATTISQAGYWHIKTNIPVDGGIMFLAKFYGYIYGSAQVLDLQHSGYAYAAGNTVINQGATNNGSNTNASSALYASSNGNKVTFRIAFGAGATFSTYFAGVYMDICFPNPAGRTHDFEIEAQTFNQSGTVY